MIYSELKKFEDIEKLVEKEKNIYFVACNGCAEVCQTSDSKSLEEMKKLLEEKGKKITGVISIDFLCSKNLIVKKLKTYLDEVFNSDCILVFSCGIGVQCVSKIIDIPVYPATDTIYMGGFQGLWPGEERCIECGTCYLGITGGICPIAFCTKQLVNGPCGGTNNGKCEIDPDKDCGWALIYEKLESMGKLDLLLDYQNPRDFQKIEVGKKLRKKIYYNVDSNKER